MLNYTTYVQSISNLTVVPITNAEFQIMIPNMIDDAEQRNYRELDLLNTVVTDTSGTFSSGNNSINLPSANGTFVTVKSIYAISPTGTRNSLLPASRAFINICFPSSTGSGVPQYFAPVSQSSFVVGPWPSQSYAMEVVGTIRPAPLSVSNATTLLSVYFPDLFVAASMVFAAGYLQNYGSTVDNPQQGVTWEMHYKALLQSAQIEEARKKFTSEGWSSEQPAPLATPPRN